MDHYFVQLIMKMEIELVKYKYKNQNINKIVEKEKIHEGNIFTCYETNDGIVTCGIGDKSITLWSN